MTHEHDPLEERHVGRYVETPEGDVAWEDGEPTSDEDAEGLPEYLSGYQDAPKWYWRIAENENFFGWKGDVSLWAVAFGFGALFGLLCAIIVVKLMLP